MTQDEVIRGEWVQGLRLAAIAFVSATAMATLVIWGGRALLEQRSDSAGAPASVRHDTLLIRAVD